MSSFEKKTSISAMSAMIFAVVNNPKTYQFTDQFCSFDLYDKKLGCPTNLGRIIHTFVFFLLNLLRMNNSRKSIGLKVKYSIYGALVFFLISSPSMYSLVRLVFGDKIADKNGCPTMKGITLHALVHGMVLFGLMYLPSRKKVPTIY